MSGPAPEFCRLISVARLSVNGIEEKLDAKPEERMALARRFDLIELPVLKAQLDVQPGPQQTVKVTGKIIADVVQRCVVTLEPIANHFDLDINITFIPQEQHHEGAGEPLVDDLEDEVELFSAGKIDLGEMVAQQLGINLDPYPRKPNAALGSIEFGPKAEKPHPFAGLATNFKTKKKQDKAKD